MYHRSSTIAQNRRQRSKRSASQGFSELQELLKYDKVTAHTVPASFGEQAGRPTLVLIVVLIVSPSKRACVSRLRTPICHVV